VIIKLKFNVYINRGNFTDFCQFAFTKNSEKPLNKLSCKLFRTFIIFQLQKFMLQFLYIFWTLKIFHPQKFMLQFLYIFRTFIIIQPQNFLNSIFPRQNYFPFQIFKLVWTPTHSERKTSCAREKTRKKQDLRTSFDSDVPLWRNAQILKNRLALDLKYDEEVSNFWSDRNVRVETVKLVWIGEFLT
jgi:hypothetical protein